jgi:hypothetical protein
MNIKKPIAKKVVVAFPDAAMKLVAFTVPNIPHATLNPRPKDFKPINMDFKGLFCRLRKTTK